MGGNEKIDFTREEQINFTCGYLKKLKDNLNANSEREVKLLHRLNKYKEILNLEFKEGIDIETQIHQLTSFS